VISVNSHNITINQPRIMISYQPNGDDYNR